MKTTSALAPLALVVAILVGAAVYARRRGYHLGANTVVRCRDGHLFTTIWIPGASFKSIRIGWYRWQHCPIGDHWTWVVPVRDDDLTPQDRMRAELHHDVPLP